MESPSAVSPTLATAANRDGAAGGAAATPLKPANSSEETEQQPPTPPISDTDRDSGTEPFPALDSAGIASVDPTKPSRATDDTPTLANNPESSKHENPGTPNLSLATAASAQAPPSQRQQHLDVDTTSPRSQTSPVTPPYWNHVPPSLDRRPFLSSRQPGSAEQRQQGHDTGRHQNGHYHQPLGSSSSAVSTSTLSATSYEHGSGSSDGGHSRGISSASMDSLVVSAGGITMRDNEAAGRDGDGGDDRGSACWARSVAIRDHVVVNGGTGSIGAFVVWNIRVETLTGSHMNICKRYSEFDDLRSRLLRGFPRFEGAVPELPPKSLISKFRPSFLEKRRAGLQYFLNCIMLNPEFSGSPILKEFLFS